MKEVNEENKFCDGLNVYSKTEYINVIYPNQKENIRKYYNIVKSGYKGPQVGAESSEDHAMKLERGLWRNQPEYIESGDFDPWF